MLKKYFSKCPYPLIVILNILCLIFCSPLPFIGAVFIFGFFSKPLISERLFGIFLYCLIPLIFFVINFIFYKAYTFISLKINHKTVKPTNNNKTFIKKLIFLILIIVGSSLVIFSDDIWIKLNGWWF